MFIKRVAPPVVPHRLRNEKGAPPERDASFQPDDPAVRSA
jgi:hypothetical protein